MSDPMRPEASDFGGMVSVVMPAFNESEHVAANVREVVSALGGMALEFEVVVVDDGSTDGTHLTAARALLEQPRRVRIIRYDGNQGKGHALTIGSEVARGELILFLDADLDLHPRQLPVLLHAMREYNADVVVGSKWHPDSCVSYPRLRTLYSHCYYWLIRGLFGLPLRDTQTGIKLFKMALLRDVLPRMLGKRFAFDVELLAIAHSRGYRIVDAPVALEFRRSFGRLGIGDVWGILRDTLAVFYRLRLLRYYDPERRSSACTIGARLPAIELSVEAARELVG